MRIKTKNFLIGILMIVAMLLGCFGFAPLQKNTVKADDGYTVTLYANDGLGTQKQIENVSGLYVLPECDFTPPAEKTFMAWAIGSESGEQKQPGAAINVEANILVVAIWTESAGMYETRPNGGITQVNDTFDIRYRLTIQPESIWLEFYNDYQKQWAENFMMATMPASEGALTHFEVPTLHKDIEETVLFRLVAYKDGIAYYSNTFAVQYTNNRFTVQPQNAHVSVAEEYTATYAMNFTPSQVTLEYYDGEWKTHSKASETEATLYSGTETTMRFRICAICGGDAYYSKEFKVQWADVVEVSTFSQLVEAVNADKTYIKLMNNIEDVVPDDELPTKHRLMFDGGKNYVLDLNGYELVVKNHINVYFTADFPMIEVSENSALEVKDGNMVFDNYHAKANRKAKGVVAVMDDSIFTATRVNMKNAYTGTVVYATGNAQVTLNSGEYTVQNGFALYLERQASLTLDDVYVHTMVGDSAYTQYVDGYGALYSESKGALVLNNAFFKSGVQVSRSQIDAFSTATHEVSINGKVITEDVFYGTNNEAKQNNKEYYWYTYNQCSLCSTENSLFTNTVRVISYEKQNPITVEKGTAMVGGVPVTEARYGEEVTVVAEEPEAGMEFVRWESSGVSLADKYSASTTFIMGITPVEIKAYYGKETLKAVSVNVADITVGQKVYNTEITLGNGVVLQDVEWREESLLMNDYDIFKAGKTYSIKLLVYPPEDQMFSDGMTATVNGKNAIVSVNSQYAYIDYTFETTPSVGFAIVYDGDNSQLGVGGKVVLNTALMATQSAEFKAALDAEQVTYQWYRNDEAVEGATDAVYYFTTEDVGGRFYVVVTANGKTNYGHNISCGSTLYKVYLNASEIVPGDKAPRITAITPGIFIDLESLYISEILGENTYGMALKAQNAVLVPGKSYRLVGMIVEHDGVDVAYGASVYINNEQMDDTLDASRFFYDFTVAPADYPVYYKTNGAVGIGVTLTVDVERMCNENGTFKNAYDKANPTYQTVFYQWYKNGEEMKGETNISYTVKTTDRDSYIHCKVTLVDGKYGIGEQQVITNAVTVFNVEMPMPKNGETRIVSGVSVDGVGKINIMWWPKETGTEMQGKDTYVEGTVYVCYMLFSPQDTFTFATAENRTVYIYGKEAMHESGYAYSVEITAIHKHQYSEDVWNFDEYGHWMPCVIPGCPNPDEEYEGYVEHWGGGATCKTEGKCGQCGAMYIADHDFSVPDYQYVDEMKCANFCENCDVYGDWSYHEGGVATCQSKSICEICHHEYGKFADHAGGKATCTAKAVCATCGEGYGEMLPHTDEDENGKCDVCDTAMGGNIPGGDVDSSDSSSGSDITDTPENPENPEKPNNPETPNNGLSGGAIAGIVIGSVAVAGVGGFSIFWFAVKKKTFAELAAAMKELWAKFLAIFKKK